MNTIYTIAMAKAITLSFTEETIAKMDRYLARGEKSAFIERAVLEKLHQLQKKKHVAAFLAAVRSTPASTAGTAVRLLRRQRRTH